MKRLLLVSITCLAGCRSSGPAQLLFVSNEVSGDITIIDTVEDAPVGLVRVGKRPRGLHASPDGKTLYVAVSGSPRMPPGSDESKAPPADRAADGIAVIDLGKRELVKVLPSGQDPESFDLTPDGKLIYVSNEETAEASIVEVQSGKILAAVPVGKEPEGVTVAPDGKSVWVTSEEDGTVAILDVGARDVALRLPVGARPRAIAFTPDGKLALVTSENAAAVTLVDAPGRSVKGMIELPRGSGPTPPRPMGVAIAPDGKLAYVSGGRSKSVSVIDVAAGTVVRTFEDVGARTWGVAVTRDGKKLYTANGSSNDVSVLELPSGRLIKRITVGEGPWGLALAR